jgi:hypothetical protein
MLFAPKGFPRKVKEYAYCIEWYLYKCSFIDFNSDEVKIIEPPFPPKGRFVFKHLDHKTLDISKNKNKYDYLRKFPGIYPCIEIGGKVGYYRVIGEPYTPRNTSTSDLVYWDDGKSIDLELVFVK